MTKSTQNFLKYIGSLAGYFLAVLAIFLLVQRPIFLFYNQTLLPEGFNGAELFRIYIHGLQLDIATAAFITAPPLLLVIVGQFSSRLKVFKIWKIYNTLMALFLAVITVMDVSMYELLEFKPDTTGITYVTDPDIVITGLSGWEITFRVLWIILMTLVYQLIMWLPLRKRKLQTAYPTTRDRLIQTTILVGIGGVLFIAIRGFHELPNNPQVAFYSETLIYNHSALNPTFNCIYSNVLNQHSPNQEQIQNLGQQTDQDQIKDQNQITAQD